MSDVSVSCKLPVTALLQDVEHSIIFAAQGGLTRIYTTSSGLNKAIDEIFLFKQSVIHGYYVLVYNSQNHLVSFGGKEIGIIPYNTCGITHNKKHLHIFSDRVLDVVSLDCKEESNQLAVALAHNSVLLYDWCKSEVIKEIHCMEKCILYSAHFIKENKKPTWENLVLCAGTVFNQIVVWKTSEKLSNERAKVLSCISGHDGVIFNISYNPATRVLLSASDDRSIRVWKLCGSLGSDFADFLTSGFDCACVMYGHEARIWRIESFLRNQDIYIISVAEDGFCIVWKLLGSNDKFLPCIVKKMNFRSNLLSLSLDSEESFVVGAVDGSIRLLEIDRIFNNCAIKEASSIINRNTGTPKVVKLLTKHRFSVLVHTDAGTLLRYDVPEATWAVLQEDHNFGSYAVMDNNCKEKYIVCGSTKGKVKVLELDSNYDVINSTGFSPFPSKVLNASWFEDNLFVSGPDGRIVWCLVRSDDELMIHPRSTFTLPPAKHRWHISIIILHQHPNLLVCGDRRGSVHLFSEGTSHPVTTCHGVHGKLGVTSLVQHGDIITSTGRDGHWRRWWVGVDQLKLLTKHRSAQGMDWLEGLNVINQDGFEKIYVHGFHGNKFVVWSKQSGEEMFSILCGGGHRSWDFSIYHSKFVFLKAGQLNIVEVPYNITKESILESGLHSQHINCVCHLATYSMGNTNYHIVASAGEDTNVIISYLVYEKDKMPGFEILHVIDDHSSNIRAISAIATSSGGAVREITLYTCGGRASIQAHKLKITTSVPPLVFVEHIGMYTSNHTKPSDVRFMSITAWDNGLGSHQMAIACSDGKIRLFQQENTIKIDMKNETVEMRHCFLTISRADEYILAGSTDGHVYVMTDSLEGLDSYKCHQSGVNSLAVSSFAVKGEKYLVVASGGDDNAIHVMLFEINNRELNQIDCCDVMNAHSGQVTGLHLKSFSPGAELTSVSIDQRLISWSLLVTAERQLALEQLSCSFVHVADISCMAGHDNDFYVCGQGLLHCISMAHQRPLVGRIS